MVAGDLNKRAVIQQPAAARDGFGADDLSWTPLVTVWAKIEGLTANQFFAAQQAQSAATAKVTIRKRADLDETMRVQVDSVDYLIEGILPDKQSPEEYLVLMVSRVQGV